MINPMNLLTPLLGRDDSQDGVYTIKVMAVDKAGNQTEVPIEVSFLYDNVAPRLVSLRPTQSDESFNFLDNDNTVDDTFYYNFPINGFVATFDDDSDPTVEGEQGVGIDLTAGGNLLILCLVRRRNPETA